jgi:methionyl-tRNA formyltransferase
MKLSILASGKLGFDALVHLYQRQVLTSVFTDHQSDQIIQFARQNDIPLVTGNPRNKDPRTWQNFSCDVLLSINYLFIIEKPLIDIANKYAINIHGSLLPKYRGRTPHVWAIINGETETGITAHLIDEGTDTGDIIEQHRIKIGKEDTGADVLKKFNDAYPELIDEILRKVKDNNISTKKQEEDKATYFGKRTPLDGRINWQWQKERIHNWIRAQAHPYPGAFFYYQRVKVQVHECAFDETGYNYLFVNGKILRVINNHCIVVKTPNGAVRLSKLVAETTVQFGEHKILE